MAPLQSQHILSLSIRCHFGSPLNKLRPIFLRSYTVRELGPESPNFVEIPQPPQISAVPRRRIRGVLPVPRNIFPKGSAENVTQGYIEETTPEPRSQETGDIIHSERVLWKKRLAKARRRNLRQGILELKTRAIKTRKRWQRLQRKARMERSTRLNKPEPEDERLTIPTMMQAARSLLRKTSELSNREEQRRMSQMHISSEGVAEQKARESKDRIEDVRTLYINATHFITDMSQLNGAIDEAFGSLDGPATFGKAKGPNIWFEGELITIQDRLNERNNISTTSFGPSESRAKLAERRLNKIANMLLGKSDKFEAEE